MLGLGGLGCGQLAGQVGEAEEGKYDPQLCSTNSASAGVTTSHTAWASACFVFGHEHKSTQKRWSALSHSLAHTSTKKNWERKLTDSWAAL